MQDFDWLLKKLKLPPLENKDHRQIFTQAFTHRSYHKGQDPTLHNERIEFLGDAVLELVTTNFLYHHFPRKNEGTLTSYRSALVKRETLAQVSRRLDLGLMLKMSRGEAASGGREKDYLLANLFESLIGAVYLCYGLSSAQSVIEQHLLPSLSDLIQNNSHIDSKSQLQELTQGKGAITPHYQVLKDEGKDHEKTFTIGVFIGDQQIGVGQGGSKKEAETAAAADALAHRTKWGSALS